jgi:hypothetical protein
MFTLFRLRLARVGLASALAVAATLIVADARPAAAYPLKGKHPPGEVAGACFKAGGTFTSGSDGSYACSTAKGAVRCSADQECGGACDKCPKVVTGRLNDVLRPPAAGTISATGSSAPAQNKKPVDNVHRLKLTSSGGHANHTIALRHSGAHSGAARVR